MKKRKRKSSTGFVIIKEYGSFDSALRDFTEGMQLELVSLRRHTYYEPKKTHNSRKTRGNKQESFRAKLRNKENE